MQAGEIAQHRRKDQRGKADRAAHPHNGLALYAEQPVGRGLHFDERLADRLCVGLTNICQLDALWQALEQLDAKMMFQLTDLLADGSWRQVQLVGGGAE